MILKPKLITKIEPGHRFSKGLVGSWIFNEGGGDLAYDTSGNGNHGTLVGNTHYVAGKFGNALEFDGAGDWADVGDSVSLNITGSLTISFWMKSNILMTGGTGLVGKDPGTGNRAYRILHASSDSDGTVRFVITTNEGTQVSKSSTQLQAAIWYHIVGRYDGTNVSIFVNAVEETSEALAGAIVTNNNNVFIGARSDSSNYFSGQIDNVIIYNRALTAGEIKELYHDPFQMFKRNL